MKVKLLFFAAHKRTAGVADAELELADGSNARDAARLVEVKYGLELKGSMVAVNDEYADPDRRLESGDTLAFIPPVAGGTDDSSDDFFLVTPEPLDLFGLHARLIRPGWGGQAMFTGSTRTPNKGLDITHLEYDAYPAMCLNVMKQLAVEVRARWELGAVVIAHRTGTVLPAEVSIFVGVGSAHRRACLDALPWLVDEAKLRLPVWKLEVASTGERWVEGSTTRQTL
jgi:molybdopterin synthase catalytic subunit